jgi:protein-disulfide isomerase
MKKLTVLGPGCPNCKKLASAILGYGVVTTPALVVDGEVKVVGRVPPPDEIKTMLG